MHRFLLFITFLLFLVSAVHAQFAERVASGRPGNANGAFSVGKGVYQVQTGFNFIQSSYKADASLAGTVSKNQLIQGADAIFRIGIKEDMELRIGGNFIGSDHLDATDVSQAITNSGLAAVNIGIRNSLFQQKGILPATAVQFTANFGGGGDYKKENPDATFRINFSNLIGKKVNLNWNFSSRWVPDNSAIVGFYIFSFSYPLADGLAITAEAFGNMEEQTTANGGLGFSYHLNNNFQIDLYGSYGRRDLQAGKVRQEELSLTSGISYRLIRR